MLNYKKCDTIVLGGSVQNLVDKYIKENSNKELLDLVFQYENKIDLKKIANHYINIKDSYYICELISFALEYLDIDDIFDKIIKTNDEEFMFMVYKNGTINEIVDMSKLRKALYK